MKSVKKLLEETGQIFPERNNANNTEISEEDSILDEFLGTASFSTNSQNNNDATEEFIRKVQMISSQERRPIDTNVLEYWNNLENCETLTYKTAEIILGAPATQVSVERAFSMLALVLTSRRTRLSDQNLNNILSIKLNSEILNSLNSK
jgi:hypothetical protein